MSWSVILVDQDYDHVEAASCMGTFETEKEASDLIERMKEERDLRWKEKIAYVEEFVENKIKMPLQPIGYDMWHDFADQYPVGRNTSYDGFKRSLKSSLVNGYPLESKESEEFNPPTVLHCWNNLFAVENEEIGKIAQMVERELRQ